MPVYYIRNVCNHYLILSNTYRNQQQETQFDFIIMSIIIECRTVENIVANKHV